MMDYFFAHRRRVEETRKREERDRLGEEKKNEDHAYPDIHRGLHGMEHLFGHDPSFNKDTGAHDEEDKDEDKDEDEDEEEKEANEKQKQKEAQLELELDPYELEERQKQRDIEARRDRWCSWILKKKGISYDLLSGNPNLNYKYAGYSGSNWNNKNLIQNPRVSWDDHIMRDRGFQHVIQYYSSNPNCTMDFLRAHPDFVPSAR